MSAPLPSSDYVTEVSSLISAIVPLLWVFFAFVALLIFRADIKILAKRVRKGRFMGQELELGDDLQRLNTIASAARDEVDAVPVAPSKVAESFDSDRGGDPINRLLQEATKSPLAALIILGREIELQTRRALATLGHLNSRAHVPIKEAVSLLSRFGFPASLIGSVELFQRVRNAMVHTKGAPSNEDILSAIDSGITILAALRAMPLENHVVHATNITLYSDANCSNKRTGVFGVLLKSIPSDGRDGITQIFPTTCSHFSEGMMVAWEWNINLVTGPTWYKDLATGDPKNAWTSSAEFTGRNLDDV